MTFSYIEISDSLAPHTAPLIFLLLRVQPLPSICRHGRPVGRTGIFSMSLNLQNSDSGTASSAPLTVPVPCCDLNGKCPPYLVVPCAQCCPEESLAVLVADGCSFCWHRVLISCSSWQTAANPWMWSSSWMAPLICQSLTLIP